MWRLLIIGFSALSALLVSAVVAAWFALPGVELASYASPYLTRAAGRRVEVESLRITPGLTLSIAMRGVKLANIEGGSRPEMLEVAALSAEVELLPLVLRGEAVVHGAAVEGMSLLLERAPGRRRNWRLGGEDPVAPGPSGPQPESRRDFPYVPRVTMTRSEVLVRTSSGRTLRIGLDDVSLETGGSDQPVQLNAQGAYNRIPLRLETRLGSFEQLWDWEKPFPFDLTAQSRDTTLRLRGTATDPLNFDGISGHLSFHAPDPQGLLAIGEIEGRLHAPVRLEGDFQREGDLWRLRRVTGELANEKVAGDLLELREGGSGQPDRLVAHLGFEALDLNRILGGPERGGDNTDIDLRRFVSPTPDPLIEARLTAGSLAYGDLRATAVRLQAATTADRVVVDELEMRAFGARITAAGQIETRPGDQVAVTAGVRLREGDLDTLRRAFGLRSLPLSGRVEAIAAATGQGQTLNGISSTADISAVVSMPQGMIDRQVIELASTDIRALFRTASGRTPISCLLGVVHIRAGRGELSPLRIQAGTGSVGGMATFDLNRRTLDAVIGSQRDTTSFWALDVPMQISGSFANPSIRPAQWSADGRARLAAADNVAAVPAELRDSLRGNRCFHGGAVATPPAPARASSAPPRASQPRRANRRQSRPAARR
ncbi:AsmA family protein [Roseococcus sp. YIM B11640]|uniref:AsmA family protein n=1 Tax=Roseococcus sp. YIM B11640 TaxID=3133973 RepID=UPI003C7EC9DA